MSLLTLDRRPSLQRPDLLVAFSGWSDAGAAATTAVQYVSERTEASPFARIDGEEIFDFTVQRPLVRLDRQRIRELEWPSIDFHASESAGLVLLSGPEPHFRWKTFCEAVVEVVRETGVARVALLGAYLADIPYSEPVPLTGFSSDADLLERLRVPVTAYAGPTGIVGALAERLQRESIPLLSLWAAIPHSIAMTANPRGALALLLKLREWLPLRVDFAPLESAAAAFQGRLLEALDEQEDRSAPARARKKPETSH